MAADDQVAMKRLEIYCDQFRRCLVALAYQSNG